MTKNFKSRWREANGRRKGVKVYPAALKDNEEALKAATETLIGDLEALKGYGEALKIDRGELKGNVELKSNGEAFRAKKMH